MAILPNSQMILQNAVAPKILPQQLPSPQEIYGQMQQPQQKPTLLNSPAFSTALLKLGQSLSLANEYGMSTGAGMSLGFNAFAETFASENERVRLAEQEATDRELARLKDLYAMNTEMTRLDAMRAEMADRVAARQEEAQLKVKRDAAIKAIVAERPELANLFALSPQAGADVYDDQFAPKEVTPHTDLAKLTVDYKNGLIDEATYKTETEKAISGAPKNSFESEDKLRDEYNSLSGDFFTVEKAYSKIKEVGASETAAGDMSLIFGIMKMNDPGSTVREGEYATAQNAGSVPDRVVAAYNSALKGEKLSSRQRKDFVGTAEKLYQAAEKSQEPVKKRYEDLAKRNQLNPENVTGGTMAKKAENPVVGGFEYLGVEE